jgi:TonB family protein
MNTEAMRRDWMGQVVDGRYTLLQWLGGSESCGVFLTELHGPGSRKAAIKLVQADAANAEVRIAGWAAASALSHPHLMRLLQYGRCQIGAARLLYVLTEYAEEVLSQILPQRALTPTEAREMLEPVLGALAYLHAKGYVHGGLNPSNIMAVDDQLKLSCDSLQVAGDPGGRLPARGIYQPPECVAGTISPAADLWSLGVTLVESLTQHPPAWDRSKDKEPIVPESIPQPLAGIVRDCLRSDPERRCTLADLRDRLEAAGPFPGRLGRIARMLLAKLRWPGIVAAALVLVAAVAFLLPRSRQTQPAPSAAVEQPASAVAAPPQTPVAETQSSKPAPASAALPAQTPAPQTPSVKGAATKGEVAQRVLPDVPQKASATIRGNVQVSIRVTVDPGGVVSNAALDSPGSSRYFAKLALDAARRWRFKPARVDGRPVSSVWLLRFDFGPTGTQVTPAETAP